MRKRNRNSYMKNREDVKMSFKNVSRFMHPHDTKMLYDTASEIAAQVIVEVGAYSELSTLTLGTAAQQSNGHVYVIEPELPEEWYSEVQRLGLSKYVTPIKECSPWLLPETMASIKMPIDYLYLGGNFLTMQYVSNYHFWQRYVRREGRIVFNNWLWHHDVINHAPRAVDIVLERDQLQSLRDPRDIMVFRKDFD